ncbi:GSCOCG00001879001-RA-CDS [Cotesia congregata]|nr:GSCOCG00001879001-RA-CDS [Cotesia congregata]
MVRGQGGRCHLHWGHGSCWLLETGGGLGGAVGVLTHLRAHYHRQGLLLLRLLRSLVLTLLLTLDNLTRHPLGHHRAPRSPLALAAAAAAAAAVGLDVLREMVAAHEPLVADRAGESLFSGVGSKVPLQLIRTCEPLATEKPVANKRSLTSVPPQVGLQM